VPEVEQGERGSQEASQGHRQRDRHHYRAGRVRVCHRFQELLFHNYVFSECHSFFLTKMLCKLPVLGIEFIMKRGKSIATACDLGIFKVFITFESKSMSLPGLS
jgi:hypothetical protein